jgi:hypothetical protein
MSKVSTPTNIKYKTSQTVKAYSAVVDGKNRINVFDLNSGVRSYNINLGNVTIINGPIVTQDKLTIVVQDSRGKTTGKVYSLKNGILSYSFTINNNK